MPVYRIGGICINRKLVYNAVNSSISNQTHAMQKVFLIHCALLDLRDHSQTSTLDWCIHAKHSSDHVTTACT